MIDEDEEYYEEYDDVFEEWEEEIPEENQEDLPPQENEVVARVYDDGAHANHGNERAAGVEAGDVFEY